MSGRQIIIDYQKMSIFEAFRMLFRYFFLFLFEGVLFTSNLIITKNTFAIHLFFC